MRVTPQSEWSGSRRAGDKFQKLDETYDGVLYAPSGRLEMGVCFCFLFCSAHRNVLASYADVAVIGASRPCAPTKGPPVSSHTNLNLPCVLLAVLPLRRVLVYPAVRALCVSPSARLHRAGARPLGRRVVLAARAPAAARARFSDRRSARARLLGTTPPS